MAISPSFSRGVIRCKRCRSRVVGNVDRCPFCGKSLKPFYARLWFWSALVVLLAVTMGGLIYSGIPVPSEEPAKPAEPTPPQVVGAPDGTSFKDLATGTTVDSDSLLITVTSVETGGTAYDGTPLVVVTVEFSNKKDVDVTLYSTQWRMEQADGTRLDAFIGTSDSGQSISSNFEARSLEGNGQFTGKLYFKGTALARVLYAPTALTYNDTMLVTWTVPAGAGAAPEGEGEDGE
ncbi:MAG: DUF4352 domain-containing protein [Coriobacteriales bacterium]|nr:DUF4352 domain-containing protein [Coriobacteriales bacterium]